MWKSPTEPNIFWRRFVTSGFDLASCVLRQRKDELSRLRSAVGEREKWSGGGEERLANRSRSTTPPPSRRRKPTAPAAVLMQARDERAICGVERASSRGGWGRRAAR